MPLHGEAGGSLYVYVMDGGGGREEESTGIGMEGEDGSIP